MRGVVGAQQGVLLLQLLQQPALRAPKHRVGVKSLALAAGGLSATRMDVTGSCQQWSHRRTIIRQNAAPGAEQSGHSTQVAGYLE